MKNYGNNNGLNNSRKISKLTKTPPKKTPVMSGVTFSDKPNPKNSALLNSNYASDEKLYVRTFARSIEQQPQSTVQNEETVELFGRSLAKVKQMQAHLGNKSITGQLNEILGLIQTEKQRIAQKMRLLRSSNEAYRKLCDGCPLERHHCASNTDQLIDSGEEPSNCERAVQCGPIENQSQVKVGEKKRDDKRGETYSKLQNMLLDMNIDPREILPEWQQSWQEREFKRLGESEIIKIQKFFIKKLVEKVQK